MSHTIRLVVFTLITLLSVELSLGFRINAISTASNGSKPENSISSVAYVKASIPLKIFQCMQRFNIMRCMRIFILQRMERTTMTPSGNLTGDFLDRILSVGAPNEGNLWETPLAKLTNAQLNERLQRSFQTFFNHREVKLYFIPGVVVKIVPSLENYLHFTIKKNSSDVALQTARSADTKDELDGDMAGLGKKKPYKTTEYLLQLGVPALMMPAILLGTVLPFLLPALKMATLVSAVINHGALMTAAMYAAKQAAFDNEKVYYSPSYHRDLSNL